MKFKVGDKVKITIWKNTYGSIIDASPYNDTSMLITSEYLVEYASNLNVTGPADRLSNSWFWEDELEKV